MCRSTEDDMTEKQREGKYGANQGEGNRDAANRYDEAATRHAREHDVKREARKAERAIEGSEAQDLKRAEAIGKRHAKEEDPALRRDDKRSD
jgi:hypothetical protein